MTALLLHLACKDIGFLSRFLSEQLESCSKWLVDNRLSLHVDKCESIVFCSQRKVKDVETFKVTCFGKAICRVSVIKYLGVYLDETLSGVRHANDVLKKAKSRLSFLYRNAFLLDQNCRKLLCMALI